MKKQATAYALTLRLIVASLVLLPAVALVVIDSTPAAAQQQPRQGRTLFDLLFGNRNEEPDVQVRPRNTRPRPRATQGAGAAAVPQAPAAVEKAENAQTVLVVGDFMADGMSEGLIEAFAQAPNVEIVSKVSGSSGFVRDDHFNWPVEIAAAIAEAKPVAVIVMLGSNDRQQMSVNGTRERVRTEAWTKEYQARVLKLAEAIRRTGVQQFWVGLPSFKQASANEDLLAFNDIYRTTAEQVGGEFVDIWDGFIDETGAFASFGPDMNGQRVRLRNSDGLTLTRAGKRKLAFYLERPLERVIGSSNPLPGAAQPLSPGAEPMPPTFDPSKIDRTPPMALNDPALDGGNALMGATVATRPVPVGVQIEKLVGEGIAPAARSGRADDS